MVGYITGKNRVDITFPEGLEALIALDNPVRFIDAFVNALDLEKLGFAHTTPRRKGRPGYDPATMLKIYVYGYLNREQSSRRLEREARTNIELMWLIEEQTPDYTTIANFRKDNGEAICAVCNCFTKMCRNEQMFADLLVVVDGSKFKAVNSPNKNYTMAKINRQIKGVEGHVDRYLAKLEDTDKAEEDGLATSLEKAIEDKQQQLVELNGIKQKIQSSPDKQISLTDPDSRAMKSGARSIVGYNVQIAVDNIHHFIIAHDVTNAVNDCNQLYSIAHKAQETIGRVNITVLADKGYYTGAEIVKCREAGMKPLVPQKKQSSRKDKGLFLKNQFIYDTERDLYICPTGKELPNKYTASNHNRNYVVYCDSTQCKNCESKWQCIDMKTADKTSGGYRYRRIMRWEHEETMAQMQADSLEMPEAMTIRKSTVEHPFGTLKFWMGSVHFLTKGLKKVSTEMSLNVMSYNLRRMINIFGVLALIDIVNRSIFPIIFVKMGFLAFLYQITSLKINQGSEKAHERKLAHCHCSMREW